MKICIQGRKILRGIRHSRSLFTIFGCYKGHGASFYDYEKNHISALLWIFSWSRLMFILYCRSPSYFLPDVITVGTGTVDILHAASICLYWKLCKRTWNITAVLCIYVGSATLSLHSSSGVCNHQELRLNLVAAWRHTFFGVITNVKPGWPAFATSMCHTVCSANRLRQWRVAVQRRVNNRQQSLVHAGQIRCGWSAFEGDRVDVATLE